MHARDSPTRDAPDDLLLLEDLDDLELLRCLKVRYEAQKIYTWVGSVLVSVNPYCDIGVFKESWAALYGTPFQGNHPQPHLFAAVAAALGAPGSQHALLISGESGAGKTEATRAALSFLAKRCGADESVKERLLHSNPVLEAFGNAQTRQNGNSSRFGKFIEVHISHEGNIAGATLKPYMLEASRVTGNLPKAERTYHIFYLLRAALSGLRSGQVLKGKVWQKLAPFPEWAKAVQNGGQLLVKSSRLEGGPPEAECICECEKLLQRLFCLGMSNAEVAQCACVVAAVALLADESSEFPELVDGLEVLLGIAAEDVKSFFTRVETRVGNAGRERFLRERGTQESRTLRASLAQELYAALFAWLTRFVARGISPPGAASEVFGGRKLGFLDLCGFEVFNSNGFEQFLINYCNERIQQLFNRQVFLSEAEEYTTEGLSDEGEWQRLKAACCLPALTLLEGEPGGGALVGIFGVINDRSRCGFEDDRSNAGSGVAEAIAAMCGGHSAFRRSPGCAFGVAHFAGEVVYDASQFVRKNASAHRPEVTDFFRSYGGEFARSLFAPTSCASAISVTEKSTCASGRTSASPTTLGRRRLIGSTLISSFRTELNELCAALESRECRHIRCLRPNDAQEPLHFEPYSMLRQCNYSGLLEATRIRRFGYAHRRSLSIFESRYEDLIPDAPQLQGEDGRYSIALAARRCAAICSIAIAAGVPSDELCVGKTKVFLRATSLAWLEGRRNQIATARVSASVRRWLATWQIERLRRSTFLLQASARGFLGRLEARRRRKQIATQIEEAVNALLLQAGARGFLGRLEARRRRKQIALQLKVAAQTLLLQASARGFLGRLEARRRRTQKQISIPLEERAQAAVTASIQHSPNTIVHDVPLSTLAGYHNDRLPGSTRMHLANKLGDFLTMGALARSPARSPLGAPRLGTKRRQIAVRGPDRVEKENEEPMRNEHMRKRSPKEGLLQKQHESAFASPQISTGSQHGRVRQVLTNMNSPFESSHSTVGLSRRVTSPQRRQAVRDLTNVNLGSCRIREPWSSRVLAATVTEAVSQGAAFAPAAQQPRPIAMVSEPGPSPRTCSNTGNLHNATGSLVRRSVPTRARSASSSIAIVPEPGPSPRACSNTGHLHNATGSLLRRSVPIRARSASSRQAELRGQTSPRSGCCDLSPKGSLPASRTGCRDFSPRKSLPATPKLPFRAGVPSARV